MSEIIGVIILVVLLFLIVMSGGFVILSSVTFQDILREYCKKEKHEISKKELIGYFILFIVCIIIYGGICIGLLTAFWKVTHHFW